MAWLTLSPGGCWATGVPGTNQRRPKQQKEIKFMKNRSNLAIFVTMLSVLACIGLAYGAVGPESPDPSPFPVNSNTADGYRALENSGNNFNAAFGWFSLFNTDSLFNSGFGAGTLFFNNGTANTAVGTAALFFNTTGDDNNAVGVNALRDNDSGFFNNAHGRGALFSNTTGGQNNAFGDLAMESNTTGNFNTAMGDDALDFCTTGNSNTALGDEAGTNLVDGEGNIYIGAMVNTGGSSEQEFIRIGNDTAFAFPYDTYIAGIFNRAVDLGTAQFVFADATGKIGTVPVNANGNTVPFKPQAMLDESCNQQKRIAELEGTLERLAGMVKAQATQIQKVSAELEVSKPAPHVVANKP